METLTYGSYENFGANFALFHLCPAASCPAFALPTAVINCNFQLYHSATNTNIN